MMKMGFRNFKICSILAFMVLLLTLTLPAFAATKPSFGTKLNTSHALANGLVGCWLFNEGSGDKVYDLSGYNNEGTFQGGTSWTYGKFGHATSYDGNGDYISIADKDHLDMTSNMTIVTQMKPNACTDSDPAIIAKGDEGYVVRLSDSGYEIYTLGGGGDATLKDSYTTPMNSHRSVYGATWQSMSFTAESSYDITAVTLKLYKKGSPGDLTVSIRKADGGLPDLVIPGTLDTDGDGLTTLTAGEEKTIELGSTCPIVSGTQYTIVIRALKAGDTGNHTVEWKTDVYEGYANGLNGTSQNGGVAWTPGTTDCYFKTYGTSGGDTRSGLTVTQGAWNFVALVYHTSTVDFYVNGVSNLGVALGAAIPSNSKALTIGRSDGDGEYAGIIDHVLLYNRALTGAEIALLYSDPFCMFQIGEARRATDSVTELPIQGVTVTLYTAQGTIYTGRPQPNPTKTDANGYYALEADPGMYYITATKEDYEDYKSSVFTVQSPVTQPITMIPLDQAEGKVFSIVNTVDKKVASIGDVLTYKVGVTNLSTSPTSDVSVTSSLPHDFRLVKGSVRIDGVNQNDPTDLKGPTFNLGSIGLASMVSSNTKTITYRVIVGPDSKIGKNKSYAYVTGSKNGTSHTQGPAVATVDIREGVFSKKGALIGKVYHDKNKNGKQDKDEPGIPGVAVILDDGTTVITDKHGRYSFPEVSPGIHAVRLDQRMLPGGPLYKEKPETKPEKPEPLIKRRSLGDWIRERLHKVTEDKE